MRKSRRGLEGLDPVFAQPQPPVEVLTFPWQGVTHAAHRQERALCVNGIDNWWLTTRCGHRLVVTTMAAKGGTVDCIICLTMQV